MMKKLKTILSAFLMVSLGVSAQEAKEWGDESKIDTLSYASGVNVAFGLDYQFGYAPFDYDLLEKNVSNIAMGVATLEMDSITLTKEQLPPILADYFGKKYQERYKASKAIADSLNIEDKRAFIMSRMFESEHERALISKAFGMNLGYSIYASNLPVKLYWVLRGMRDWRADSAFMDNDKAMYRIKYYYEVEVPLAAKKRGDAWLSEMAHTKGVKVTPSGLVYKIENAGDKEVKALSDEAIVTVHYKGSKQNGEVFDASRFAEMPAVRQQMQKMRNPDSYDKDEPLSFPLKQVIAGWTEGLKLIGKGGKITLWVPSQMAYGERGAGDAIGPNEALRFDIELIDVKN